MKSSRQREAEQPEIQDGGSQAQALSVAFAYLNRRERTVAEVRARLERADVPVGAIEAALDELVGLGYLDDARYARVFVEDKRNLDGWGKERIELTLRERGISRELIATAVAVDQPAGELDRAVALLARRFPAGAAERRDRERAFGVLVRKGYDTETAADAVRAWSRT